MLTWHYDCGFPQFHPFRVRQRQECSTATLIKSIRITYIYSAYRNNLKCKLFRTVGFVPVLLASVMVYPIVDFRQLYRGPIAIHAGCQRQIVLLNQMEFREYLTVSSSPFDRRADVSCYRSVSLSVVTGRAAGGRYFRVRNRLLTRPTCVS